MHRNPKQLTEAEQHAIAEFDGKIQRIETGKRAYRDSAINLAIHNSFLAKAEAEQHPICS